MEIAQIRWQASAERRSNTALTAYHQGDIDGAECLLRIEAVHSAAHRMGTEVSDG